MAWMPRMAVIDDFKRTIPKQNVKWLEPTESVNKCGRKYSYNKLTEGDRDIEIMPFDGAGIHTPEISKKIAVHAKAGYVPSSIMWRSAFLKGVTTEVEFASWFKKHGVETITDMFGKSYNINELDMIITKSMWKGSAYFRTWEEYVSVWEKYGHCMGYVKFNTFSEDEKVYTRASYQILQDIRIPYEEFKTLAQYSQQWGDGIAKGLNEYIWNFTGLIYRKNKYGDIISPEPKTVYDEAILRNPEVLNDSYIRNHYTRLVAGYMDGFCCGKLYLKGAFKLAVPDLIAFMEFAAGMDVKGSLKQGEVYITGNSGLYEGNYILERNPHIARSEHLISRAVNTPEIKKYLGGLNCSVMFNTHDISMHRLSGCDFDGDLILCIKASDYPQLVKGINMKLPVVMNIDDKTSVPARHIDDEELIKNIESTRGTRIGQYSNTATKYNNKVVHDDKLQKWIDNCVDEIAIVNAKEIDSVKTQIKTNLRHNLRKRAGRLPYFMKYAGQAYSDKTRFSYAKSNMNMLCFELEKWKQGLQWAKPEPFSGEIYFDSCLPYDKVTEKKINSIYNHFTKMRRKIENQRRAALIKNKKLNKSELKCESSHKYNELDNNTRNEVFSIEPSKQALANYIVRICYSNKTGSAQKSAMRFAWLFGDCLVQNISPVKHMLPMLDDNGSYDYLGKKYIYKEYIFKDEINSNIEKNHITKLQQLLQKYDIERVNDPEKDFGIE